MEQRDLGLAGLGEAAGMPLAERLRPRTLDEVVGQDHLLGPGAVLRAAIEGRRLHSMILWGPPGVGKTTLARLLAHASEAVFLSVSAVLGGVKEIREAVEQALVARQRGRGCIVFVDEVHRFNKAQQDAFLPHVESGLFVFVGATTENPAFEVNAALLSRAAVHVLQPLDADALARLLQRAVAATGTPGIDAAASARLADWADGDARRLLNAFEQAALAAGTGNAIDVAALERALGARLRRYDKGGDLFYDTISALHKSVRGSDPDAALYWLARMLDAGVDAAYIARRLVRMASEDVGLADPRALAMVLDAAAAYERLGAPEGELALAQAAVYLAVTAKSNAVYAAWKAVRRAVADDPTRPVPAHLRNAPTALARSLGHGQGYRYAHDEPGAFSPGQRYLPDGVDGPFYEPTDRGLEARIGERLAGWRAASRKA